MAQHNRFSLVILIALGLLWYANLVVLVVANTDYPGSYYVRDHTLIIGIVLLFLSGCLRQTYVMWKKDREPIDE